MDYYLGIDIGTSVSKVVLIDHAANVICKSFRPNTLHVNGVFAEENPDEWWDNICDSIKEVIAKTGINNKEIAAVSISCLGAIMAVDESGKPLTNAIVQMDKRALKQLEFLRKERDKKHIKFSNPVTDGVSALQTILWLKEEQPEVYKKTAYFMVPNSYIAYKLTDRFTAEHSRNSTTLLFNLESYTWDKQMCDTFGLDIDKLPPLVGSDEIVGTITDKGAEKTGLAQGTPVVAGMLDTASAGLGVGATDYNDAYVVLGTFGKLCIIVDRKGLYDSRFANFTYTENGKYILYISTDGGCGLSITWFRDTFGYEEMELEKVKGRSAYSILDELTRSVSSGSDGLFFLPQLTGGKSPSWNLNAKGVFFGIDRNSTKGHFFKAIMEGISYSTRLNLELYEAKANVHIDNIKVCGGGTKSEVWLNILSSVLGRNLIVVENSDSEAFGAACVALKAMKGLPDYHWIPTKVTKIITPDKKASEKYDRYFEVYKKLYHSLDGVYEELRTAKENVTDIGDTNSEVMEFSK